MIVEFIICASTTATMRLFSNLEGNALTLPTRADTANTLLTIILNPQEHEANDGRSGWISHPFLLLIMVFKLFSLNSVLNTT